MGTNQLFLVDGAFATGKSDLLLYLQSRYGAKEPLRGPARKADFICKWYLGDVPRCMDLDLWNGGDDEFSALWSSEAQYSYEFTGVRYTFEKQAIDVAFSQTSNVFVIVRDVELIKRIQGDRQGDHSDEKVVPVYLKISEEDLLHGLRVKGIDASRNEWHLERRYKAREDFINNDNLYTRVVNYSPCDLEDFQRQIDSLISHNLP